MNNFREQQEHFEHESLFELAKKSSEAKRWKIDADDPYRTDYQRDVGRIIYSDAFRRLRMKTQVFTASGTDEHSRTRLTHTLEVSQIAKSISRPLRLNLDLTEAIALGHDLGHTPFGHAGENALKKCLEGKGDFNHNVQSVWILRTTWCGRKDKDGINYRGFNLTHDVTEGIWKHTDYEHTVDEVDGLEYYSPTQLSSLEGQTVDIADGIAYLKHDIDDGVRNKIITFSDLEDLWTENSDISFNRMTWNHNLVYDVISNSINKDLVTFSPDMKALYKKIKKFIFENVIKSQPVKQKDEEGIEKICTIFNYCLSNPDYVINKFPLRNEVIYKKHGIERVAIDFIQWLGDENANNVYQRIKNNMPVENIEGNFYCEEEDC